MTRVLRQYSKSELEAIVEHAVRKQLVAEQTCRQLRRRVWGARLLFALGGFGLGMLFR